MSDGNTTHRKTGSLDAVIAQLQLQLQRPSSSPSSSTQLFPGRPPVVRSLSSPSSVPSDRTMTPRDMRVIPPLRRYITILEGEGTETRGYSSKLTFLHVDEPTYLKWREGKMSLIRTPSEAESRTMGDATLEKETNVQIFVTTDGVTSDPESHVYPTWPTRSFRPGGPGHSLCKCEKIHQNCLDHPPWLDSESAKERGITEKQLELAQWIKQCPNIGDESLMGFCQRCSDAQMRWAL